MQSFFRSRPILPRTLLLDGWWLSLPIVPQPGDPPVTDLALPASPARFSRGSTAYVLVALLLLVALGDWLCFGQSPGAGEAVFAGGVIAACCATAAIRPTGIRVFSAGVIGFLGQIPWLLAPGTIALGVSVLGTACAAACISGGGAALWPRTQAILRSMVWRIAPDLLRVCRRAKPAATGMFSPAILLSWVLPVLGGAVFLGLFADANPLIASGLSAADPLIFFQSVSPARLLFWLGMASVAWPFLAPPVPKFKTLPAPRPARGAAWAATFGAAALGRALILFNLLFALQTGLDAVYLWGGAKLPEGLTYADYAHRGAYPLILTALLAGGFAILATRPGRGPAGSQRVRLLLLLWIGQNLGLVGSSIFRLWLYVQVYSLSELRLASFIWMLLVFVGLVLIVLRIILGCNDAWLLRANAIALLVTLYMASCLNFPWAVAEYDVTHCSEVTGSGAALDLDYLQGLGPQAIPALDRYQVLTGKGGTTPFAVEGAAGAAREMLAANFTPPTDWRGFSFWSWVLACYLVTHDPETRQP
jgi:hypothetical protein